MKKTMRIFALLLSLVFAATSLCACGTDNIPENAISDIAEANLTKNLLKTYDSIAITVTSTYGNAYYYIDSELGYLETDYYQEITTENYQYGNTEGVYYRSLFAGTEMDTSFFESPIIEQNSVNWEVITRYKKSGDYIKVKSEFDSEDVEAFGMTLSEEEKGGHFKRDYVIDDETFAIFELTETFTFADGTKNEPATISVEYNVKRPSSMSYLIKRAEQTEEIRTVTVITDPGTDKEESYSITMPQGDYFMLYLPEGYTAYTDLDCTEAFVYDSKPYEDLTLYAK